MSKERTFRNALIAAGAAYAILGAGCAHRLLQDDSPARTSSSIDALCEDEKTQRDWEVLQTDIVKRRDVSIRSVPTHEVSPYELREFGQEMEIGNDFLSVRNTLGVLDLALEMQYASDFHKTWMPGVIQKMLATTKGYQTRPNQEILASKPIVSRREDGFTIDYLIGNLSKPFISLRVNFEKDGNGRIIKDDESRPLIGSAYASVLGQNDKEERHFSIYFSEKLPNETERRYGEGKVDLTDSISKGSMNSSRKLQVYERLQLESISNRAYNPK